MAYDPILNTPYSLSLEKIILDTTYEDLNKELDSELLLVIEEV